MILARCIAGILFSFIFLGNHLIFAAEKAAVDIQKKEGAQAEKQPDAAEEKKIAVNDPAPFELIYGNASAPVTMVEYASLSCSHCGNFHKSVFPVLKKQYIDSGKVRFIFRSFPLNLSALKAAVLVACAPDEKKSAFINVLFKTQDDWAYEREFQNKIKTIATLGGLSEEAFNACMANQGIEDSIVASRLLAARQLAVSSTPTFFINGVKFEGERTVPGFAQAIDLSLTASKKPAGSPSKVEETAAPSESEAAVGSPAAEEKAAEPPVQSEDATHSPAPVKQ